MAEPAIVLSRWADAELRRLAEATGSEKIAALNGATLLGERAALNGFSQPGLISTGGGCRLYETRDGWVALNLARPDDRELLPALFESDEVDDVAANMASVAEAEIVARGREMGLAIAGIGERGHGPTAMVSLEREEIKALGIRPLVIDLSALWAGPLAGRLLRLAGAEVIKVESRTRPDAMRDGDPALFARLNEGKADWSIDLREDRETLIALIRRADIVIEAARPRALAQLGIDADALVRETPGLVWMTITAHGVAGDAANWVGFGDDVGVAAGLSAALLKTTGKPGFVGDAIADPLTGIHAARLGWERRQSGRAARIILSMRDIAAEALRSC
jgi:crotonobetainyl-CoA:carnitine CoA-transferase CaiB-like acyl-CoA transferase